MSLHWLKVWRHSYFLLIEICKYLTGDRAHLYGDEFVWPEILSKLGTEGRRSEVDDCEINDYYDGVHPKYRRGHSWVPSRMKNSRIHIDTKFGIHAFYGATQQNKWVKDSGGGVFNSEKEYCVQRKIFLLVLHFGEYCYNTFIPFSDEVIFPINVHLWIHFDWNLTFNNFVFDFWSYSSFIEVHPDGQRALYAKYTLYRDG